MRAVKAALLAGVAALALAGIPVLARADSPPPGHDLTIQLPGGGTAQIHYTGNVAPQVVLLPGPMMMMPMMPMMAVAPPFGPDWGASFADFDRMMAEMNRATTTLLRQAATMAAMPPPGAQGYRFVATMSGNNVCMRSVTITDRGAGLRPTVVSQVSGHCAPAAGAATPARQGVTPPPARQGNIIRVRADGAAPANVVRPVPLAWQG